MLSQELYILKVQVSIFNTTDLDYIEPMNCLGVVLATPEQVFSGVTDRSGIFEADLTPGKYFLSLVDPTLSPTTKQGIPYLLDYPVTVSEEGELIILVEIDSSEVESELDIPEKLKISVVLVSKPQLNS